MDTSVHSPLTVSPRRDAEESDQVVLLNEVGQPIGQAPRSSIHSPHTPLHLAFSTYLFNARGEVLLTRRALSKKTWPGVWTNSCCGHPQPGEELEAAIRRRIRQELGLRIGRLIPLLPDFRYRATDSNGIVENEICPVYAAVLKDHQPPLMPDPDEVAECAWVPWPHVLAAVAATPQVYSPWAAQQIALLGQHPLPDLNPPLQPPVLSLQEFTAEVDALLAQQTSALIQEWASYTKQLRLDILPEDLPAWLEHLLVGQGKRLRVMMTFWGFAAAGGRADSPGYHHAVRAAAALETLHLFALIHDDVMDESSMRRGFPAAHVQAAQWHRQANARGDAPVFGRNLAILLGDLAHTTADRLAQDLPEAMRQQWYALSVELIAGQRADLTAAAAGRREQAHAQQVADIKSGHYTITRPLHLGACAAQANSAVMAALTQYATHVGRAFAWRDDYLGVWGDPVVTGKPAGEDLLEAKATVLLSVAQQQMRGWPAHLLARVGTAGFGPLDAAALAQNMHEAGVDSQLEAMIAAEVEAAVDALNPRVLPASAVAGLGQAAQAIAWRDA